MSWLRSYGYSDCVLCDIVGHQPWEPASFVYEDEEVAVFHNVLNWIPVMLLTVPRGRIQDGSVDAGRHYHQLELWRKMGHLGAVAMAMGRSYCQFEGYASFRLVCNVGSLALQTQSHAHIHVLGPAFQPSYPDLRCGGELLYEDGDLLAYGGRVDSPMIRTGIKAVMVVPRAIITQDEFFARMNDFGPRIVDVALAEVGDSFRLLAEVGPHAPLPQDGAHLFILGGGWLGHYV